MSNLMPYTSGGLERDSRRAARAISRHHAGTQVRLSRVDDETDITVGKVEAITSATGTAMSGVARVAQAQKQLEAMAPEVSGRLSFLADAHALAMGDLLQDLRADLRRR